MTSKEEWRSVVDFPDYEVSSLGRVRSWRPRGGGWAHQQKRPTRSRLLKPAPNGTGRMQVGLAVGNGKRQSVAVHTMVAAAFIGPRPLGMQVCHSDGDCLNNVASNLRYGTSADNAADRILHGRDFFTARAATFRERTHCLHGHRMTPDNTLMHKGNRRRCRECARLRAEKRNRRLARLRSGLPA